VQNDGARQVVLVALTEELAIRAASWFRGDPVGQAEFGGFYGVHPRWWDLARSDPARVGFIAVSGRDEEQVGFLDTEQRADGHVDVGMYVRRERRRQGLGTAILLTAIEWARTNDLGRVIAAVHPDNLASHRCCEAAGLRDSGVNEYGETLFTIDLP
jgi:RimJ/RimL family protein N-acetyltransferase